MASSSEELALLDEAAHDASLLPVLAKAIWSDDNEKVLRATTSIWKLLLPEDSPFQLVVDMGIAPQLVSFLRRDTMPELQVKAAMALATLCCGTAAQISPMIECNAIPSFVRLLDSSSTRLDIKEKCCWALSNIAATSAFHRDLVFKAGAILPLLEFISSAFSNPEGHPRSLAFLRTATWTFCNFCGDINPHPDFAQVNMGLPMLVGLVSSCQDDEVLKRCCWALFSLSEKVPESQLQAVINSGICQPLVDLMNWGRKENDFMIPAVETIQHLVEANNKQVLINSGILPCFLRLLHTCADINLILAGISHTIAELCAGTTDQIQDVLRWGLIPAIVDNDLPAVQKDIARAVSNCCAHGTGEQVGLLMGFGCIEPLASLLDSETKEMYKASVKAMFDVLKVGETFQGQADSNPFAIVMQEADVLPIIKELQETSGQDDIIAMATYILGVCAGASPAAGGIDGSGGVPWVPEEDDMLDQGPEQPDSFADDVGEQLGEMGLPNEKAETTLEGGLAALVGKMALGKRGGCGEGEEESDTIPAAGMRQ